MVSYDNIEEIEAFIRKYCENTKCFHIKVYGLPVKIGQEEQKHF